MERVHSMAPRTVPLVSVGACTGTHTMSLKRTLASSSEVNVNAHAHLVEARAAKAARACEQEQEQKEKERIRDAFTKMEEEYTCPITLQFPTDPVIAEDGHIYERSAIEEWFATHAREGTDDAFTKIKSPCTNLFMHMGVIPAKQVRNAIEHGVRGGLFVGERAEAWLKKTTEAEKHKKAVTVLKKMAESGDKYAAFVLSKAYGDGLHGLKQDEKQALKWSERAANLGHAYAATQVGLAYHCGRDGLEKNVTLGIAYMQLGAVLGSECGCYEVGHAYQHGKWGYPVDHDVAAYWYRRMEHAEVRDAGKFKRREKAAAYLKALQDDE